MKKTSIQFHATNEDLYELVMEIIHGCYKVYGILDYPQFEVIELTEKLDKTTFSKYRVIIISKNKVTIANSYNEFIKLQDNYLGIRIGIDTNEELTESFIWTSSATDIDSDWKKIISSFKKKMNKGAWATSLYGGKKQFYKNHLYTDRAKSAYEKGVKIRPMAGCVVYELHD
jgi:hypothetical protein